MGRGRRLHGLMPRAGQARHARGTDFSNSPLPFPPPMEPLPCPCGPAERQHQVLRTRTPRTAWQSPGWWWGLPPPSSPPPSARQSRTDHSKTYRFDGTADVGSSSHLCLPGLLILCRHGPGRGRESGAPRLAGVKEHRQRISAEPAGTRTGTGRDESGRRVPSTQHTRGWHERARLGARLRSSHACRACTPRARPASAGNSNSSGAPPVSMHAQCNPSPPPFSPPE